ncbi:MAG: endonuclease VII domain-containing protein [Dehalococcoidia bacterium]|nr:endonuclease VII domain-containing protein [Dehalococcoidia bacterium]
MAQSRRKQDYWLRKRYGISLDTYEEMAADQQGRCLICDRVRKLVVDHDHITGAVRGLLCRTCNSQLAFAEAYRDKIDRYLVPS